MNWKQFFSFTLSDKLRVIVRDWDYVFDMMFLSDTDAYVESELNRYSLTEIKRIRYMLFYQIRRINTEISKRGKCHSMNHPNFGTKKRCETCLNSQVKLED